MNSGNYQNDINDLPSITIERYENIFKVYNMIEPNQNYYFYNILNKINIPDTVDSSVLGTINLDTKLAWTIFSYKLYRTQHLWWLIALLNTPYNVFYAEPGKQYRYILPRYVNDILANINKQLT